MMLFQSFVGSVLLSACNGFVVSRGFFLTKRCFVAMTADHLNSDSIRFGFTGDVMIARAIDAILPTRVDGTLHEPYVKHANEYIRLAEQQSSPLDQDKLMEKGYRYVWGDLMEELRNMPDYLVMNLETSLTTSNDWEKGKAIHYRAHPKNVEVLEEIGVKLVTLANNHVLDWGIGGLQETMRTLNESGICYTGAGYTEKEAKRPSHEIISDNMIPNRKNEENKVCVKVLAIGFPSAGVPLQWAASDVKPGVYVAENTDTSTAETIMNGFLENEVSMQPKNCINIVSLHWGPNWGWGLCDGWRDFAHKLIDKGAHMVIGHSSHHVKGVEIYNGKMIAYGMGDFLNDYEGIVGQGHDVFRGDLTCLYLPSVDSKSGDIIDLLMVPCKIKNLKVSRATDAEDIEWLRSTISNEGTVLGTSCETCSFSGHTYLRLQWNH